MKILWVNSGWGKTLSNTRLYGMPPALQQLGAQSIVLIAGKAEGLPDYFLPLPVPFYRLAAYRFFVTLILPFLIWRYKPDVVMSDWMSARLTRLAVWFRTGRLLRCRFVHDVRTVPVKDDGGKSWGVYAGSLNYALRHFDGLTTITEPLRDEICQHFNVAPERIAVWTSGVDVNHFRPQDSSPLREELGLNDKFVLFYHGSVNHNRGVVELALAMDDLRDQPDWRLLIVGAGNEWNRLSRIVREKRLDQVILKTGVSYDQIPRWIALADLCLVPLPDHPWWRVSSPLKLMEYLAMGKPVLLTEMGAHRAILPDNSQAFYVPRCHPQDFAEGIRRAWSNRDRFARLGESGRCQAMEVLTWFGQAKILHHYLLRVLRGEIVLRGSLS